MDDLLLIFLTALVTALVVSPIAFKLGVRHKNRRWKSALDHFEKTGGLAVSRRKTR